MIDAPPPPSFDEAFNARPRRKAPEVNVIPMINVVFLLLFFFMVSGARNQRGVLDVRLPVTHETEDAYVPQVEVSVARDGRASVGGKVYASTEEAAAALAVAKLQAGPGRTPQVNIRADESAPAVALLPVINAAEQAGYAEVYLVSRRQQP